MTCVSAMTPIACAEPEAAVALLDALMRTPAGGVAAGEGAALGLAAAVGLASTVELAAGEVDGMAPDVAGVPLPAGEALVEDTAVALELTMAVKVLLPVWPAAAAVPEPAVAEP